MRCYLWTGSCAGTVPMRQPPPRGWCLDVVPPCDVTRREVQRVHGKQKGPVMRGGGGGDQMGYRPPDPWSSEFRDGSAGKTERRKFGDEDEG